MTQVFFKVDPECFNISEQFEQVNDWMQQHNLRTSEHGILVYIDYSVVFRSKVQFKQCIQFYYLQYLVGKQYDLGSLIQNRFNVPKLFANYKFTVTGFRKEKIIKDEIIQLIKALGGNIVKIQSIEQIKMQIDRQDMNYYIIVYQPKLLLKLFTFLPEYEERIVNKCRSIYALFHACRQLPDDFNPGQYLDEQFTRLQLLENSQVGISKIPSKSLDDRMLFKKISLSEISKTKYITYRLHSKTSEAEHLLKEEFYMYYKQDIKQFYDVIIPYETRKGQYKVLQNQFPMNIDLSYWSLYINFSQQVLLCVEDVENVQQLNQLFANLLNGCLPQSIFNKYFDAFMSHITIVPFSNANKVPLVLTNKCFFVLTGNNQYQIPRNFHSRMSQNPINLRNSLWLVTVFLQCSSESQLFAERQARPTQFRSQSQYSQLPYTSNKQLPFLCCELRNIAATVVCSYINIFLHEVQMTKNPINPDQLISIIYSNSITQQEKSIFKQQLVKLLNIDENLASQIKIQNYEELLQNALANNFQMQIAIQSQLGFDDAGAVIIKQETDSFQSVGFGTFSQNRNSPFIPKSADDLVDDQFGTD